LEKRIINLFMVVESFELIYLHLLALDKHGQRDALNVTHEALNVNLFFKQDLNSWKYL